MNKEKPELVWRGKTGLLTAWLRGNHIYLEVGRYGTMLYQQIEISAFWHELAEFMRSREQLTAPTQELLTKEKFLEIVNDSDNYTVCGSEYSLKYDWDKIFEKLSKLSKMAEEKGESSK